MSQGRNRSSVNERSLYEKEGLEDGLGGWGPWDEIQESQNTKPLIDLASMINSSLSISAKGTRDPDRRRAPLRKTTNRR